MLSIVNRHRSRIEECDLNQKTSDLIPRNYVKLRIVLTFDLFYAGIK